MALIIGVVMSASLRPHLLRGFLRFLQESKWPLTSNETSWIWTKAGNGIIAQRNRTNARDAEPVSVKFTIFGQVLDSDEINVVTLGRPEWNRDGAIGRELAMHFDLQLLTLAKILEEKGWKARNFCGDKLRVIHDGEPIAIGGAYFATATLTIKDSIADNDEEPYVLHKRVRSSNVEEAWKVLGPWFTQDIYEEQDWNEPPLSVYNYAAVRILEGHPYDEHWCAVLSTINVVSLYKLALTSKGLFTVIMAHVRAVQPPSGSADEHLLGGILDRLSTLPLELFGLILPSLTLKDRLSVSRTSRKFAALFSRELQAGIARILLRFGLSHAEICFMQSATMSVISGQCIPHLLDYTSHPQHLDFYTPDVTYQSVLRFFTFSTGYEMSPAIFNNLSVPEGHDDRAKFAASSTTTDFIRVSRSITNSALDSVTYSPFSHLFGAVTHYGVWFAYPETSLKGITMPNRDCMDFDAPETEDRVVSYLDHLKSHFRVNFHLDRSHRCGVSWECPMTPRSTADKGCLSIFFPSLPFGLNLRPDTAYPNESAMHWSLGGRLCPYGAADVMQKDGMRNGGWLCNILSSCISNLTARVKCSCRRMSAFPLHQRLDVDRNSSIKAFLANAIHGVDFAATRDRGSDGASFWSFKPCCDSGVNRECPWCFPLRPYRTALFGRVDLVEHYFLYDEQLRQLKHMVAEDHDVSGALVRSDWFSPIFAGSAYPAKDGCFYVSITGRVGAGVTFGRGDFLELDVNFRFTQSHKEEENLKRYILAVDDVWCLPTNEVASQEPGYVSYCLLFAFTLPFPFPPQYLSPSPTMVTTYLQDYVQARARSLAFVKFPDNLVATRDRGSAGGSSFSFKDVTSAAIPSIEPGIIWPTQTKRGSEKRFQCNVFGEVRSARAMEAKGCVSAELGCPKNATCAVVELWENQLRALNDITEGDVADAGGVCTGSWLTFEPNGDEEYRVKETFWVNFAANTTQHYTQVGHMYADLVRMLKPGRMVDALVWFQRLDITFPEDDLVNLNYYLTARRVVSLDNASIAKKEAGYVCDKVEGGCQICAGPSGDC
ncbi:hypothetical protein C8F04DRAFT_1175955 [Mycena alexandri]|uniref:F-box domain-containing protein n=1 Tax=Mycena alexandri TaxID=1745969 RepID=A0AAD6TAI2_9AGAR|nr:hypothetical protein C8F04DRAFT_1175955 [Mycena alexandri]